MIFYKKNQTNKPSWKICKNDKGAGGQKFVYPKMAKLFHNHVIWT